MATLHIRTDQFSRQLNPSNDVNEPSNKSKHSHSRDSDVRLKKSCNSISSPASPDTISTCSSWTSASHAFPLSLRPTFSVDSSSDGISDDAIATPATLSSSSSNAKSKLTTERKKWIEETLINKNEYQPYSTSAREEICKYQNNNKSSVAERREWLSGVTNVKSAADFEEEVRGKARMQEVAREKAEKETKKARGEEEACQAMIIDEDATTMEKEAIQLDNEGGGFIATSSIDTKQSFDEVIGTKKKKKKKLLLKGLVKRFTRKRK